MIIIRERTIGRLSCTTRCDTRKRYVSMNIKIEGFDKLHGFELDTKEMNQEQVTKRVQQIAPTITFPFFLPNEDEVTIKELCFDSLLCFFQADMDEIIKVKLKR